jgi:hypothetical protein
MAQPQSSSDRSQYKPSASVYRVYSVNKDHIFMCICEVQYTIHIVPEGKVNITGAHSVGHSKQKSVYVSLNSPLHLHGVL